jgi:DNA-binding transcriptional MerR regulator
MYNIKQAAARAGVSVPVLRQWERRYGVVHPERSASGYRRYDDPAIARVRAMRHLMDDGWSASAAAASVGELDDTAVAELLAPEIGRATSGAIAGPDRSMEDPVEAFARAAADLDLTSLEGILDEMFASGSFELVADRYLVPALTRIGDAWASGAMEVAAEHAASHAVWRRLAIAYQASARPSPEAGVVLVGLPPGSRHELGALMFSVAARRAGLPVVHLGADLPVADWLEAATHTDAIAAVVGVVSDADVAGAADVVHAVRSARPGMLVAVGGRAAQGVAAREPVLSLPTGVTAAVDAVRASVMGNPAQATTSPSPSAGPVRTR